MPITSKKIFNAIDGFQSGFTRKELNKKLIRDDAAESERNRKKKKKKTGSVLSQDISII